MVNVFNWYWRGGFRLVGSQAGSYWLEPLILFSVSRRLSFLVHRVLHGYCVVLIYWNRVGAHLLTTWRFVEGSVLMFGRVWRDLAWVSLVCSTSLRYAFVCVLLHLVVTSYLSQFRPCGNTHMRQSIHSVSIRLRVSSICACVSWPRGVSLCNSCMVILSMLPHASSEVVL